MDDNRILLISEVGCPPPYSGNRTRTRELIRSIQSLGYRLHFASIGMSNEERNATLPYVDEWVWDFYRYGPPTTPVKRAWRAAVRRAHYWRSWREVAPDHCVRPWWLAEARKLQKAKDYKRVIISYAMYSKLLLAFPTALRLIDTHDVFALRKERLAEQGITEYSLSFSPDEETILLRRASRIIAIQDEEAAYFRRIEGIGPVHTVGYNVAQPSRAVLSSQSIIGYLGSENDLNRHSIQWFLDKVWKRLRVICPEAKLLIAGAISRYIEAGAEEAVLRLGIVSDLSEFYDRCDLIVNPMKAGTGLKIKCMEGLGYGRCVVTTPWGAEGLKQFVGKGLFVCENADEFVRTLVELIGNPDCLRRCSEDALKELQLASERNQESLALALA